MLEIIILILDVVAILGTAVMLYAMHTAPRLS